MLKDGSYCFEAYGTNKSSWRSLLFSKTERGREPSPAAWITDNEAGTQRIEVWVTETTQQPEPKAHGYQSGIGSSTTLILLMALAVSERNKNLDSKVN